MYNVRISHDSSNPRDHVSNRERIVTLAIWSASRAKSEELDLQQAIWSIRKPFNTTSPMMKHLQPEEIEQFIDSHSIFLIDCDGVLWTTGPIPGATEAIVKLCKTKGKFVYFVTNNSTKSRESYCKKLKESLGVDFIEPTQIFCSAFLACWHLKNTWEKEQNPKKDLHHRKVYVVGEQGIVDECKAFGYKVSGGAEHAKRECPVAEMALDIPDSEITGIDAIVVGWDKYFNFFKLVFASLCLQKNPECKFIATNRFCKSSFFSKHLSSQNLSKLLHYRDPFDKLSEDRNIPGGGGMVAAIEAVTLKHPTVTGKPSSWFVDAILEQQRIKHPNLQKSDICMIGDRLDSDILCGVNAGIHTLLVMTGVTNNEILEKSDIKPDFILESIGKLAEN